MVTAVLDALAPAVDALLAEPVSGLGPAQLQARIGIGIIDRAERLVQGEARGAWPELPVWIWSDDADQIWVSCGWHPGPATSLLPSATWPEQRFRKPRHHLCGRLRPEQRREAVALLAHRFAVGLRPERQGRGL